MSVAAERSHSPTHFRSKRLFERSDSADYLSASRNSKRSRRNSGSPSRWKEEANRGASSSRDSALAALHSLFPRMEEKVLADILDSCGDNLDAAIKRLDQLQLTAQCSAEAQATVVASPEDSTKSSSAHPGEAEANGLSPSTNTECSQQQRDNSSGPRTSEEWVEALVQQMASAKDVDDARKRASHLLQAFEQAVLKAGSQGPGGADLASLRNHLTELSRDNSILKRAVAIQNTRMQEAITSKDAEVASLRSMLVEYEQKIRALELSNYSLSMHLRQATESGRGFDTGQRPPDVY